MGEKGSKGKKRGSGCKWEKKEVKGKRGEEGVSEQKRKQMV